MSLSLCTSCFLSLLIYSFLSSAGFVAVALVSRAVHHVAAVKLVPGNWMVRRPDKGESLML